MAQCVQCEAELSANAQFCASCGTQVTVRNEAEADPYVGRVFAQKYRVEQLLGEGGMGRVYRAIQLSLDKTVCLKVLRRELAGDPATQARFQREARAASRLNHPNSIQVMDFGAAEAGELYLAMEYIAGRDLQQLLTAEFPLSEARVCHIMAQVLDALAEAHAQHVIHRDLKPENIMVYSHRGDPDCVKVLDFGIAKIQDNDTQPKLTRAGLVCGTPEYMSPEQARGQELDARSDLYSSGVILYQMVTGALPFNADTPIGFVTAHLNEKPIPPAKRRPDLSAGMQSLVLRTLSKNRDERPASAKEMWSELLAIGRGQEVEPATQLHSGSSLQPIAAAQTDVVQAAPLGEPKRAAPGRRPPQRARRSRLGLSIGVGLAMVVLASGAVAAYRFLPARSLAAPTPPPSAPTGIDLQDAAASLRQGKQLYMNALGENDDQDKRRDLMEQSLKQFFHAYKLDPANPEPLKWIGNCYQDLGNVKAAVDSFKKYVGEVPEPVDAPTIQKTLSSLESQLK